MLLKLEYTNVDWWYSVVTGDDIAVLVATVPGIGCYSIAMVLSPEERELVAHEDKEDLTQLARDFVAMRDMPIFKNRIFAPMWFDAETMELPEEGVKKHGSH